MRLVNKVIYNELKPYSGLFLLALVLIFLTVGFEALNPWPFKALIDNVLGSEVIDKTTLSGKIISLFNSRESLGYFVALVYFLNIMFGSLSEYFSSIVAKKLGNAAVQSFAKKIFSNLEYLTLANYKKRKIGDYIYHLGYDVPALGSFIEMGIIPFITNALYLITTGIILTVISRELSYIVLPMIPIIGIGVWMFNNKIDQATNKAERSSSTFIAFIEEALNQMKNIHAFNREDSTSVAFADKEKSALDDSLNTHGWTILLDAMVGVIIAIGYGFIVVYGIRAVFSGQLTIGLLVIFFFYLDNITLPMTSLMVSIGALRENYVKIAQVAELLDPLYLIRDNGRLTKIDVGDIHFQNVSVQGEGKSPIMDQVTFTIPTGKRTVILGVSGSGKTTIASLILRFIEPSAGTITIGTNKLEDYSIKSLRDAIAYVPQELSLFNDSIKNNILFGSPNAPLSELAKASELAIATDFIMKVPGNYEFQVGAEGINLSGGQRQRILLARSFLKTKAKILIFDEPLSALDIKNRGILLKKLEIVAKDKTTIIISNTLEVADWADYVIMINEGKVVHSGSSKDLQGKEHLIHILLSS